MKITNTANRLKQLMNERHLKQVDILQMTLPYCAKYDVKMNKSDISQYCSGKVEPNQKKLFVLCEALNVNEAWLMGLDVPMEKTSFTEQWNHESKEFNDKINAFYYQLKSLGWSYEWLDNEKLYLLSNDVTSVKITSDEYSQFTDDLEDFCKRKLQKLLLKSSALLNAAHEDNPTPEQKANADRIMEDDSEWE